MNSFHRTLCEADLMIIWSSKMHQYSRVVCTALLLAMTAGCNSDANRLKIVPMTASEDVSPPFSTPGFVIDVSSRSKLYEGEEARRLAQEIVPVVADDAQSVQVYRHEVIPGSSYAGFSVDLTLEPEGSHQNRCRKRHIFLTFNSTLGPLPNTSTLIKDGKVLDHKLASVRAEERYLRLPGSSIPDEVLTDACRERTDHSSKWMSDAQRSWLSSMDYNLTRLIKALQERTGTTISCIDTDRRACTRSPAELMALLERTPPQRQESLRIPGEGEVTVFRYSEPVGPGQIGNDYSITSHRADTGKSTDMSKIRIRVFFERNGRPVI